MRNYILRNVIFSMLFIVSVGSVYTDTYAAQLSNKSVSMYVGKQKVVKIKGSSIKDVATSNKKIAIVNKKGVIKGVGKGTCSLSFKDKEDKIYKCKVKVYMPKLNKKSVTLYVNDKFDLSLIGASGNKAWYSDNKNIVTINQSGIIKGMRSGTTKVHVKNKEYIYTCTVNVKYKFKQLKNQKVSIVGDSISTYEGYIPKEYKTYYSKENLSSKSITWWDMLCRETGLTLLKNCSWSGSGVAGNSVSTTNAFAACSNKRINDLSKDGISPDIIICYIGINDFGKCVPEGDWLNTKAELSDKKKIDNFSEGYALMLKKIHDKYPIAKVFCCTLVPTRFYGVADYTYQNKNGIRLCRYNKIIEKVAKYYDDKVIDLYNCGINTDTLHLYTLEGLIHPNASGMNLIKNKMIKDLKKYYK